jgi:hypothetical protein
VVWGDFEKLATASYGAAGTIARMSALGDTTDLLTAAAKFVSAVGAFLGAWVAFRSKRTVRAEPKPGNVPRKRPRVKRTKNEFVPRLIGTVLVTAGILLMWWAIADWLDRHT